jgi:hypothetical protein
VINHIFEFKTLVKIVLLMEVTICKKGGDFPKELSKRELWPKFMEIMELKPESTVLHDSSQGKIDGVNPNVSIESHRTCISDRLGVNSLEQGNSTTFT